MDERSEGEAWRQEEGEEPERERRRNERDAGESLAGSARAEPPTVVSDLVARVGVVVGQ